MCNLEIVTAVAQEVSWSFGIHEFVAVILFTAFLAICGIQAISVVWSCVKKEWDWHKKPLPSKISLIAQGVVGGTWLIYVIWLLANWSSWEWTNMSVPLFWVPMIAALISFVTVIVILFSYWFLYMPFSALFSLFRKH